MNGNDPGTGPGNSADDERFPIDDLRVPGGRIETALSRLFGPTVSVRSSQRVSGGSINKTSILELSDGTTVFLKRNSARHRGLFTEEARGLRALRSAGGPRVPAPLALVTGADEQLLLLEYISSGARSATYHHDLGHSLAELHRTARSKSCGFDADNHIGSTPQRNRWDGDWYRFFGEDRLGYQMTLARENGLASTEMERQLKRIVGRLPELLPPVDTGGASLLHGDLWGGNVMCGPEGEPVLIDPAVYYGHREADLAMTELFGGFGASFLGSYRESWPLQPGYPERRDLYNLYHLLNHLNLFGSGYLGSCRAILRKYV